MNKLKWVYLGQALCEDDEYRDCFIEQEKTPNMPRHYLVKPVWPDNKERACKVYYIDEKKCRFGVIGPTMKFVESQP